MRRAFTLAELVVALSLGGIGLGAFAAVVLRQERTTTTLAHRVRARAQATEGLAALVLDLRSLSPASGDVPPGMASDSAIELRATIANLVVCEVRDGALVTALASLASLPKAADSAWHFVPEDSASWRPLTVAAIARLPDDRAPACAMPVIAPGAQHRGELTRQRYLLDIDRPVPASIGQGTPLRLTRRVRYSLYRAPDGNWYLGRREFSATLGRFETIQPVSGPYAGYAPAAAGTSGLELTYFDWDGVQVEPEAAQTDRIVRLHITVRTPPPASDQQTRSRRDVTSITVTPRNAR